MDYEQLLDLTFSETVYSAEAGIGENE